MPKTAFYDPKMAILPIRLLSAALNGDHANSILLFGKTLASDLMQILKMTLVQAGGSH